MAHFTRILSPAGFAILAIILHLASPAPTPQQDSAGLPVVSNDDFNDDENIPSYLDRYGRHETNNHDDKPAALWKIRLPVKKNDDGGQMTQQGPTIHLIDDSQNLPLLHPGDPPSTITRRSTTPKSEKSRVDSGNESESVFNIVIKENRAQRSAFIAPDVDWLRDLVPHVVEVIDQSERRIKETVFSTLDKDRQSDRQIFVNVVKSSVLSEEEVPRILERLKDLMHTGGTGVDQLEAESRIDGEELKKFVVNIIIFNIVSSDRAAEEGPGFRDSYLEALEESHKGLHGLKNHHEHSLSNHNNQVGIAAHLQPAESFESNQNIFFSNLNKGPSHLHQPTQHHGPFFTDSLTVIASGKPTPNHHPIHTPHIPAAEPEDHNLFLNDHVESTKSHHNKGFPFKGYSYGNITPRPLTNMEQDYLHKPVTEEPVPEIDDYPLEAPVIAETFDSSLPSSIFFTSLMDQQRPPIEANSADEAPAPAPAVVATSSSTSTTSNKNNRFRTFGFIAVPVVAGLAGTMGMWLPAVAALGKRKKRSLQFMGERAIEEGRAIDEKYLALLMGKRYSNVTREQLQESIDNWKYRDQQYTDKLNRPNTGIFSSTSRPLRVTRPSIVEIQRNTTTTTTMSAETTTVNKRSTDAVQSVTEDAPIPDFAITDDNDVEERRISSSLPGAAPSSNFHILPVSSNDDFDIVANFVKSTLSKMADNTDGELLDNDVFVINSASIVNNGSTMVISAEDGTSEPPAMSFGGGTLSLSSVNVFTADPIMPAANLGESVTNSPVTYVSIKPILVNSASPQKEQQESSSSSSSTTSRAFSESSTPSSSTKDEYFFVGGETTTSNPLVEFYDESTGQTYTAEEVPYMTVPSSEPFRKTTSQPFPGGDYYVNPDEIPSSMFNSPTTTRASPTPDRTTTARPTTLITIQNFFNQPSVPKPVDVQSNTANVYTTLKFTHGGIPTTNPLIDYSTQDGESSLVSDFVSNQLILASLLKGSSSASAVPAASSTSELADSSSSTRPVTKRPSTKRPNFQIGMYGENGFWSQFAAGMYNPVPSSTYPPMPSSTVFSEVDVTEVINQLQDNVTTGLVTTSSPYFSNNGIHFFKPSTELVFFSQLDATPSSVIDLDPEDAFVSRPPPPFVEAVVVETADAPDDKPVPAPVVSPDANIFFASNLISASSISDSSSSSSSSGSSSSSSSSSSDSSSSGSTSSGGIGTTTSTVGGISSSTVGFGILAVAAAAAAFVALATVPALAPALSFGKRRRTYAPARKKESFAEPPPVLYDYSKKDEINYYKNRKQSFAEPPPHYNDPGALDDEELYGPPATVFLNAKRRRRSSPLKIRT